tara:strand:+ start:1 stop:1530 length:1530 start_codon:yes stop_codon:yes gene_type:complete
MSGAGWGAFFGAGIPGIAEATGRVGNATIGAAWRAVPERAKTVAVQRIREALRNSGIDLNENTIVNKLNEIGQDAVIADLGVPTARLAATTAKQPGEAPQLAREVLGDRNLVLGKRAQQSIEENVSPGDYVGRMDDLGAQRSREARPLYDEAKATFTDSLTGPANTRLLISESGLPGEVITAAQMRLTKNAGYIKDPQSEIGKLMKQAHQQGIKEARSEAEAAGTAFNQKAYQDGLMYWDAVKRGMDSFIKDGKLDIMNDARQFTTFGRNVMKARDNLVEAVDTLTTIKGRSPYAEARAAWAGTSRLMDLTEEGTKFASGLQSQRINTIENLNASEAEAFLAGIAEQLKTTIGRTGALPAAFATIRNAGNTTRKQLERLLPKAQYERLMSQLDGLITQKATGQKVLGGSDTAENIVGMAQQTGDLGIPRLGGGGRSVWDTVVDFGAFLNKPEATMPEAVRNEVIQILLSNNPKAIRQVVSAANTQGISTDNLYKMLGFSGRAGAAAQQQ